MAREVSVIKDRFYQRVEGNHNLNRKVICKFAQIQENLCRNLQSENIVLKIGEAQSEPSTNELPQLWSF